MEKILRTNTAMFYALIPVLFITMIIMGMVALSKSGHSQTLNGHDVVTKHSCIDPDHTSCDGTCECDGMECGDIPSMYQLYVEQDYALLYDRDRFVDTVRYEANPELDNIILTDNY